LASALDASLDLVAAEPERRARIRALARYLRARLALPPADSQIVPVMLGGNDRAVAVAQALQHAGFDVRAIRPPTVPDGSARLRITVNANLTERILDDFATALSGAVHESACAVSS
jgi:8-amino-7-oxononanoate synthase